MAGKEAQVEALKLAALTSQSKIQTAANKDEAINLAIEAAESLMKAVKLTSNPEEKQALRAEFLSVAEKAERIKSASSWVPQKPASLKPATLSDQQPRSKAEEIGSWRSNVTNSTQHSFTPATEASGIAQARGNSLSNASGLSPAAHRAAQQDGTALELAPSLAAHSQIRRLVEPTSSRPHTKKEEIILWKASIVNGFKCPPWDKPPLPSEFEIGDNMCLFRDTPELSLSAYQRQYFKEWARASEAIPPPSLFPGSRVGIGPVMGSARTIDLVQDAATDCSVVASLCAAISRAERGHDQILSNKVYPFDKNLGRPVISSNGKYIVRLNFNGCWRKVVIDDRLPMSMQRLLHVVDRRHPSLLWPALLEKAYLKVRGGYDFPGSNSCSDLWIMTGWIPEQIRLQEADTVPHKIWERIYKAFMYGDVLVTLGTGQMSTRQERELGLEGQHSYVVLDMKETDHDKLLLVKNPWAEGKGWCGPNPSVGPVIETSTSSGVSMNGREAYHHDTIATAERPHPTTFYIELGQVMKHFESLYLNWNPGLFTQRKDIHFEWEVSDSGDVKCIVENPQFSFWAKEDKPVWLLLTRHFRDLPPSAKDESDTFNDASIRPDLQSNSSGDSQKGYMGLFVCDGEGRRLYVKDKHLETSDYVATPQCIILFDNPGQDRRYTVVVDHEELPASVYTFTLSVFSNSNITLDPAIEKYPHQKSVTGAWTKETAGGDTSSMNYFQNPQFTLELKNRGQLAFLLTSADQKNALHLKLTLGHGKRVYRIQRRDIICESGDHRTGCVFAEADDVPAGKYTVICSLFEAGQTGTFSLRVDSTEEVVLRAIPRDGAGLIPRKLTPACFGADVNRIAAPIVPQRLSSYTFVVRYLRATTPRSASIVPTSRSPFRFTIEKGRGPDRTFVMASEGGQFSDAATVRSEKVDLDPSLHKLDHHLVLERLSGPGGPVEEWYEVEMFTDAANACEVGVWRTW